MDSESQISLSPLESLLQLGSLLGRRAAMSAITGRCSAGHAAVLRQVRDQRLYLPLARTWEDFCGVHITITRRHADRIIGLLNELGPEYFYLAELSGITPGQFRQVHHLIKEHSILLNGDPVFLIPDNAREIHLAVRQLLRQDDPQLVRPVKRSAALVGLTRRAGKLVAAFKRLLKRTLPANRTPIFEAIHEIRQSLERID